VTDFPTILYRTPGPHKKPRGGTYAYQGAADQAAFADADQLRAGSRPMRMLWPAH
jgi:hypothetical protein